jgi:L-fuconolactonase
MFPKIDSHQHFWELGRFPYEWLEAPAVEKIRKNFLPCDLEGEIQKAGIDACVFVQTQHNLEETKWALSLAEKHPFIAGIVGWVDLASPDCEDQVLEFKQSPKFAGVRHVVHDEPDANFIVRPDVLRGLAILEKHDVAFDLLFYVEHLPHAVTLAERFPRLRMVIDHLAKPHIKSQRLDNWLANFHAAAAYPNIYCKLSGMITEAHHTDWMPTDLTIYIEKAIQCFSPQRLMFGSDWPVCLLAGEYDKVVEALDQNLGALTATEKEAIWGRTAAFFYRLDLGK